MASLLLIDWLLSPASSNTAKGVLNLRSSRDKYSHHSENITVPLPSMSISENIDSVDSSLSRVSPSKPGSSSCSAA
jgi:hypothetical protein